MAVYNKFDQFTQDVLLAKHNFVTDFFKVLLTNVAPLATNSVRSNLTEIASGNGYAEGGIFMPLTVTRTGGTTKVSSTTQRLTASGGQIGPFRYAVLYNMSPPTQPLLGWWDYGSSIVLIDTEEFAISPDATNGVFQIT